MSSDDRDLLLDQPAPRPPSPRGRAILLLTDHAYLPERVGGQESSIHDLAGRLLEAGWRPVVVSGLGRWPDRMLRLMSGGKLGYPVIRTADPVRAVSTWADKLGDPIIIANVSNGAVRPLLDRAAGRKLVFYIRDLDHVERLPDSRQTGGVHFVANSEFVASRILLDAGLPSLTVPPLIHPNRYRVAPSRKFVTFINPCELKGLSVARRVAEMLPGMDFMFVESWRLGGRDWRALSSSLSHLRNVRLLRRRLDMRTIYADTRVLLAPSQWEEGWGRVVTEAQFSGIPAVASRVGGLPESVGSGGILIDPSAPIERWADALLDLQAESNWSALSEAALRQARSYTLAADSAFRAFIGLLNHVSMQPAGKGSGTPLDE